jgi:hypothetical protein
MKEKPEQAPHLYHYLIDDVGNWYCEGQPVTDRDVFSMLSRSLHKTEAGGYVIRCQGEEHPVEVLDAPLFVHCVHLETNPSEALNRVTIELADGRREPLNPETLVSPDNRSLYCLATPHRLKAKLGKLAYYELTRHLQWDESTEDFYFVIGAGRFVVASEP